jgi:hypothetical protein
MKRDTAEASSGASFVLFADAAVVSAVSGPQMTGSSALPEPAVLPAQTHWPLLRTCPYLLRTVQSNAHATCQKARDDSN